MHAQRVLSSVLGLDVSSESGDIYPPVVCNRCYATLKELVKAKEKGKMRVTNLTPCTWSPHSDECQVCSVVPAGGKPKRRKITLEVKGRPSGNNINRAIMERVARLYPFQEITSPTHPSYFLPNELLTDLICTTCGLITTKVLEVSTCQHYLCAQCIINCCEASSVLFCCSSVTAEMLRFPPPVAIKVLKSLLVRCFNGCGQVMELKYLHQHLSSNCIEVHIPPPSQVTVEHLLHASDIEGQTQTVTQTIGLLVEKLLPTNGSITVKFNSGKVSKKV
jgi:hypothetical protein